MKILDGMLGLALAVNLGLTLKLLNWKRVMIGLKLLIKYLEESYFITTLGVQNRESKELFLAILIGFISNLSQIILL